MPRIASLLLALMLVTLAGCRDQLLKPPLMELQRLEVTSLGIGGTSLDAHLKVGNGNFYDITTRRVTYTLTIEGQAAGQGVHEKVFTVPANSAADLVIPVSIPWAVALGALRGALEKGQVQAHAQGIITVQTLLGDVDVPYVVEGLIETRSRK
ncbi:MAG: LEA type 2 family protein [Myxococcota bacterium]